MRKFDRVVVSRYLAGRRWKPSLAITTPTCPNTKMTTRHRKLPPFLASCHFPSSVSPAKRPRGRPPSKQPPTPAPPTPTVVRRDDSDSTQEELSSELERSVIDRSEDSKKARLELVVNQADILASSSRLDASELAPIVKKRRTTPEAEIVVFQKRNSPPISIKKEPSPDPSESSRLSSVSDPSSSSNSSTHNREAPTKTKEAIPHPDGETCFECGAEYVFLFFALPASRDLTLIVHRTSTNWRTFEKRTYCLSCGMKIVRRSRKPKDEEIVLAEARRRPSPQPTPTKRVRGPKKPFDPSMSVPAKRIRKRKKKNPIRWILPKWNEDWDEYASLMELSEVAGWFLS